MLGFLFGLLAQLGEAIALGAIQSQFESEVDHMKEKNLKSLKKKELQLDVPFGTACNRLKKTILFEYVKKAGENFCFQCGAEITSHDEMSIEHKIPYLDSENPQELFFDLNNIAFSHLSCNIRAGRRRLASCGSIRSYSKGCRCDRCKVANRDKKRKERDKKQV